MQRSRSILFTLVLAAVCGLFAPARTAAQQESSVVTLKQDGDTVVLISKDPGKVLLVLGYPRDEKDQKPAADSAGPLASPVGKIPARPYSKLLVFELRQVAEVELKSGPSGLQTVMNPCAAGTCDKPLPPWPPAGTVFVGMVTQEAVERGLPPG